jgi:hypothetical protein
MLGAIMLRGATHIAISLLLALSAVSCGSGGNGTSASGSVQNGIEGNFSILSYNVAGLLEGLSQSQPSVFIPMISPLLNNYDLVLAQEDFFYHDDLSSQANHPYQSIPQETVSTLSNDGLNRFSFFPFSGFERLPWSLCNGFVSAANDCLASKGFSVGRHEIAEGVFLDVYNLHMDAGSGADDVAARRAQMDQLLLFMESFSSGNAVLVGGDTNLTGYHPDDEPVLQKLILEGGFTDSARYLGAKESIDRILYRSSSTLKLEATFWEISPEFVDASGTPLSDHEAIHVEMNWTLLP